ncbi:YfbK domain-containing protein [Chitinophaga rhizosphaerae]|uniref:YfbK domain-containing protein n=1 Tax=Chitinophaga rhizosphaerae TaxID=1864947 RepID=UPI000F80C437|nr:von Willebrand factor type A domain-containing protein [Chitinophaga rhizosphaerae]
MKRILLLCAIILACGQLFAQTVRISGKVTDARSKDPIPGAIIHITPTGTKTVTNEKGIFTCQVPVKYFSVEVKALGYETCLQKYSSADTLYLFELKSMTSALQEVMVVGYAPRRMVSHTASSTTISAAQIYGSRSADIRLRGNFTMASQDEFSPVRDNRFQYVKQQPLSTFSSDVDRASFSLVRSALDMGRFPDRDAVRVEELINYFDYGYAQPADGAPVAVQADLAQCPWNPAHQLVRIGIQGKKIPVENLPPSNLVFLIDVSGSMHAQNKLPLVQQAFRLLVKQLRPQDRVAIVVYAGAAGVVLPSTPGNHKATILTAIDQLQAGGSTAGGEGIKLAYATARENFAKNGNNRVILATDGDFNVGVSSVGDLESLIEQEREGNIYLSVLGFGMGNYKDNRLETLADKGNGNYAYIDNFEEARRTFITEFGGTLFTIAKDVKLQVEFNPARVQAYRLIGYENRLLADEDFNDDKKDAGEMGSGHSVTALYELVPPGVKLTDATVDPLKYQMPETTGIVSSEEVLTVKVRYKNPDGGRSKLISQVLKGTAVPIGDSPESFRLAASVAQFGMVLRKSRFAGTSSYASALELAGGLKGADDEGYRSQFISMVKQAMALADVARKE